MAKKVLMSLNELQQKVAQSKQDIVEHRPLTEAEKEARELEFINKAPDGKKAYIPSLSERKNPNGIRRTEGELKMKGRKIPVTITFYPELLERLDEAAEASGMSRTAFLAMLVKKELARPENNNY